jgi:hypothetical protein
VSKKEEEGKRRSQVVVIIVVRERNFWFATTFLRLCLLKDELEAVVLG